MIGDDTGVGEIVRQVARPEERLGNCCLGRNKSRLSIRFCGLVDWRPRRGEPH